MSWLFAISETRQVETGQSHLHLTHKIWWVIGQRNSPLQAGEEESRVIPPYSCPDELSSPLVLQRKTLRLMYFSITRTDTDPHKLIQKLQLGFYLGTYQTSKVLHHFNKDYFIKSTLGLQTTWNGFRNLHYFYIQTHKKKKKKNRIQLYYIHTDWLNQGGKKPLNTRTEPLDSIDWKNKEFPTSGE